MKQLHAQLTAVCQEHNLPALAVTVFRADSVRDQAAVGVRKLGDPTPITTQDMFHIGSNGKAMTATLIAQLVENGRLRWDSTPQAILGWQDSHPDFQGVTLLQLLTHQAGLPPFEEDAEFENLPQFSGTPAQQRREFARYVLTQAPIHPPGSDFRYSNASFAVATVLAEAVSGTAWEEMLPTRILTPLHMRGGIGWPAAHDPQQPWGHIVQNDKIVPHDPNGDYQLEPIIAPAGDVYVAFDDYTKWLQTNLRGLAGETTLISPKTMRFLHTKHGRSGIGWGIQALEGVPISVHTGSADTFFAIALLAPQNNLGISIVTNITWEVAERPCIDLLKSLLKSWLPT